MRYFFIVGRRPAGHLSVSADGRGGSRASRSRSAARRRALSSKFQSVGVVPAPDPLRNTGGDLREEHLRQDATGRHEGHHARVFAERDRSDFEESARLDHLQGLHEHPRIRDTGLRLFQDEALNWRPPDAR